mmetsp:Transcript_52456/g.133075  ORF Transcript_52456/g.133075 Transcript_52456/m.133075 type:complete len:103 (+) Transcript_52456:243-551(+)
MDGQRREGAIAGVAGPLSSGIFVFRDGSPKKQRQQWCDACWWAERAGTQAASAQAGGSLPTKRFQIRPARGPCKFLGYRRLSGPTRGLRLFVEHDRRADRGL